MTQPEAPEHFMTVRFFDQAQAAGGVAIRAELEQLANMDAYVRSEGGFGLMGGPHEIDFVYYWTARGGYSNPHYHKAGGQDRFVPQVAFGYHNTPYVSKSDIEARGRTVVELQTHDLKREDPLTFAAARAMLAQTPEQAGIAVGAQAWLDYAGRKANKAGLTDALINGFLPERFTRSNRLAEEAARRFPGAIIFERRREIEGTNRPQIASS